MSRASKLAKLLLAQRVDRVRDSWLTRQRPRNQKTTRWRDDLGRSPDDVVKPLPPPRLVKKE